MAKTSNRLWVGRIGIIATCAFVSLTAGCMRKTRVEESEIRLNPSPQEWYVMTATMHDAPGTFDRVEGSATYQVENTKCVPLTPFEGATITPTKYLPIDVARKANGTYEAKLALDQIVDQDYFGQGTCHWKMTVAQIIFVSGPVSFQSYLSYEDILKSRATDRFFSDRSYAARGSGRSDSGSMHREDFKGEAAQTFSVRLESREKEK
jgi:hypothetical protein